MIDMPALVEHFKGAMQSQLVGGGLVLMFTGAAMALMRSVPTNIMRVLRRQFVVSFDVTDKHVAFQTMSLWMDKQPFARKARSISITTNHMDDTNKTLFTPAPGIHWFWYKRRLICLTRNRTESERRGGMNESFYLRTLGRSPAILRQIVADADALALNPDSSVRVFVSQGEYWKQVSSFKPRALSTVILPVGLGENLEQDIREFLDSGPWYAHRGIPWRRGYLFHGLPGTGKSSLISALAGAVGLNLYVLNLASSKLSDDGLIQLLLDVPPNSAVLLEDVDAVLDGRDVKTEATALGGGVTFTGLLNALDGVTALPGMIVFLTTNHLDKLDPALIRPGRVDRHIEFLPASPDQIRRLFLHFYEDHALIGAATEFAEILSQHPAPISMAEVQHHLLINKTSPDAAIVSAKARWGGSGASILS